MNLGLEGLPEPLKPLEAIEDARKAGILSRFLGTHFVRGVVPANPSLPDEEHRGAAGYNSGGGSFGIFPQHMKDYVYARHKGWLIVLQRKGS